MSDFVHLHVHSEYSLLDGAARIRDLVRETKRLGMKALALTDHGAMYGVVPFFKACKEEGIRPIIGCEVYITVGPLEERASRADKPIYHLILLAADLAGYRNLMKLVSVAHLKGFYYKPRINFELLKEHAEGLICLSSCLGGEIAQHVLHDRPEEAKATALRYREAFGDRYYLEIQDHGLIEQKKVMQGVIALSRETGIPLVATNDVHYIRREDAEVQDILVCIGTGKTLEDEDRLKFGSDQFYLKSPQEMGGLFAHAPEALAATVEIAGRCQLEPDFGRLALPAFSPLPDGKSSGAHLRDLCAEGLRERYGKREEWRDPAFRDKLAERLDYELSVIGRMGYSDYFLIVWDFIRFARDRGIAVGPGRGSSAGSLVAYALRITDVDPIRYGLLFERFLNPERVSMPDIDVDFSDVRRDEVIAYVADKYGAGRVAQIITFGTMAARAAVRDVGRAMNAPFYEVDKLAKLIPGGPGVTIEEALRTNPDLKAYIAGNARAAELLEMARKVEGMPRHASTHAAGVVISGEPLTNHVPLQEGTATTPLTQFSMENLEAVGLLKMDFLGLRTLSIIERALDWIRERHGRDVIFHEVSDEDRDTYRMLTAGDTTGVFQLESPGMRRVLRDLRPSRFEDIVSVLALYRPGPMEFIPNYIRAKHGEIRVEYPHPSLEPILRDTYGIIVYQEQIMQIAAAMAGFSLGEADLLRRAVSKKKREVLDEERAHFVKGSLAQGYAEEEANRVYDMIVRFADYGFPRAHATAYGVLAFQTAYLKAHYTVEFMASMLTAIMGNHRKVAEYVEECRKIGIAILPPDVNESGVLFAPSGTDGGGPAIRFGLAAIKNVGTQAIEAIISARQERPFASLLDFCRRVDLRVCNKRVIESLVQGGAFDSLPGHRAQLAAALDDTVEAALKWRKEREDLQIHLFGFTEEVNWEVEPPEVRPYPIAEQLAYERELLGLYLSGHPLDGYRELLDALETDPLHLLREYPEDAEVHAAGMIVSLRTIVTRKGKPMAFAELEDRVMRLEVVLFPETWQQAGGKLDKGSLVVVRGRVQHQDDEDKLIASEVIPLDEPGIAERLRKPRKEQRAPGGRTEGAARNAPRTGPRSGQSGAGSRQSATRSPSRPAETRTSPRPAKAAKSEGVRPSEQKVYIKVGTDREEADRLERLKRLLNGNAGRIGVVLFYERRQKALDLSSRYRVRPSPELFRAVEELFGEGTVRVR